MSNQTSKVIASGKGQFKNAVPVIIAWIVIIVLFSLCALLGNLLPIITSNMLGESLGDFVAISLGDAAKMLISGEPLEAIFAGAGDAMVIIIIQYVVEIITRIMQITLAFAGLMFSIAFLLIIIAHIVCEATLTEAGISGRNNDFKRFDLSFDKIVSIQHVKKAVVITYINDNGKKKKSNVYLSDSKKFAEACTAQLNAYKAANAQGA